jgi:hypothetical protein
MARLPVLPILPVPASGATLWPSIGAPSGIGGAVWLPIVVRAIIAIIAIIAILLTVPIGSAGSITKPFGFLVVAERARRRILA